MGKRLVVSKQAAKSYHPSRCQDICPEMQLKVKVRLDWMRFVAERNFKTKTVYTFSWLLPPFLTLADCTVLIHLGFCSSLSWLIFIPLPHFIRIVYLLQAFAEDDSHPEREGDDECASPKWLQSIVISGCCYFLRGAHQSFIIGCQSGRDGVGRG